LKEADSPSSGHVCQLMASETEAVEFGCYFEVIVTSSQTHNNCSDVGGTFAGAEMRGKLLARHRQR